MKSLDAYLYDIALQAKAVDGFSAPKILTKDEQCRAVFTGSGDSLASAMLAQAFSDYRSQALDPLEIGRNPDMVCGKTIYIISVSGRTVANIHLAREHDSVAVTASPDSALAQAARSIIPLEFPNTDALTAGSISFLNSALVCVSLVRPVSIHDTVRMLRRARADAADTHNRGRTFFVGNQHTFPVAMYAAAKMYEILGAYANHTRTEQFAHMELFSAKPGDTVVFFDDKEHVQDMCDSLERRGIYCNVVDPSLGDTFLDVMYDIFYAQALPLNSIGNRDEVYFMEEDTMRSISDAAIY